MLEAFAWRFWGVAKPTMTNAAPPSCTRPSRATTMMSMVLPTSDCSGEPDVGIEYAGSGTCVDPFVLDLSAYARGAVIGHHVGQTRGRALRN